MLNLSYNNKVSSKSIKSILPLLIEDMDISDMELDDSSIYNKLLLHAFLCYCKAYLLWPLIMTNEWIVVIAICLTKYLYW